MWHAFSIWYSFLMWLLVLLLCQHQRLIRHVTPSPLLEHDINGHAWYRQAHWEQICRQSEALKRCINGHANPFFRQNTDRFSLTCSRTWHAKYKHMHHVGGRPIGRGSCVIENYSWRWSSIETECQGWLAWTWAHANSPVCLQLPKISSN